MRGCILPALCAVLAALGLARVAPATAATRPELSRGQVVAAFTADGKVASWLKRYPRETLGATAGFQPQSRTWTVYVGNRTAGVVADGTVSDATGSVLEAWAGPQVYWTMARGYKGIFGGRWITKWPVWIAFCAVFLLGLADLRRPLAVRNLDLLVLLSLSLSLLFFNRGDIFTSVPLAYPPLLYFLGRCIWIARRGRAPRTSPPGWPVWALVAATVALAGVRIGLATATGNVIDVGYAGVIGAQRIATGQVPYGHFPVSNASVCGPRDSHGNRRGRIQPSGRCEVPKLLGDTYGPVVYEANLPGYALFGWSGQWDDLPAARFTAAVFDTACLVLLFLVGRRLGGPRIGATLAFAWAAYPFTLYALASTSNDLIPPAILLAGLLAVSLPAPRGALLALSGWTKFAALPLVPLWASYPDALGRARAKAVFALGFAAATIIAFCVLLFDPHLHALSSFYDRTLGYQLGRSSPFSLWDWRQFHARGIPDLHWLQGALELLLAAGALAVYFVPRRKSLLQLAALTGAVTIGLEIVMTHWFYLYVVWFFPFVAVAMLASPDEVPHAGPAGPTSAGR